MRALLAAGVIALLLAPAGTPATFVVTSPVDAPDANLADGICASAAGACTLRAAIEQANARAGADLVTVPPGAFVLRSHLTAGSADPLELRGAAPDGTIVQETGRDIVLAVTGPVVITGMTLMGGNPSDAVPLGAGIVNSGQLVLSRVIVRNNVVRSVPGRRAVGGGIYQAAGARLALDRTIVRENQAARGGGIYLDGGNADIVNSTIANNTAGAAGGLWIGSDVSPVTISNSLIENNFADEGAASSSFAAAASRSARRRCAGTSAQAAGAWRAGSSRSSSPRSRRTARPPPAEVC